jgi:tRNA(fMet)-specific endonuclease VapC
VTLLDTNTLIYYLKGRESVVTKLENASPNEIAIPSIVVYEVEFGTLKHGSPHRRAVIAELLANIDQVPFDGEAALESARIRIDLEARGMTIGPMDLVIAGTAVSRGAVLVTNNTKEFSRIKGLRLADWTA